MSSEIILCKNIKLDKNYSNVLSYSSEKMVALCRENKIASATDYSFIRQSKNTISTNFSYSDCLKSNYIAFQNKDYDEKWFFAFIDEVKYINDTVTQIVYTLDVWSTFFENWTVSNCFVVREHVTDDTVGKNTTPENVETGDAIVSETIEHPSFTTDEYCYVLATTTCWKTKTDALSDAVAQEMNGGNLYNGVYSGAKYYRMDTQNDVKEALCEMSEAGQLDNIVCIFIAPKKLCPLKYEEGSTDDDGTKEISSSLLPFEYTMNAGTPLPLNGYTPKNNKLYSYPYNYIVSSNGSGNSSTYKYEDFTTLRDGSCTFSTLLLLCPSLSGRIVPKDYMGLKYAYDYAIPFAKLPIASFQTDAYTNWLVQNSINLNGNIITTDDIALGLNIAGGISSLVSNAMIGNVAGGVMSTMSTGASIASCIMAKKQHELIPPQTTGNGNTGDVAFAQNIIIPKIYKMTLKSEYAKKIDDYFTRFGYSINETKTPNITGRPHWNYIEIASGEEIGYGSVPSQFMEQINNICRKGVTIWHNHSEIGNYSLYNGLNQEYFK